MKIDHCRATTKKGSPCTNKARYDGYCKKHAKLSWWIKYKSQLILFITALIIPLSLFICDQIRSKKQSEKTKKEIVQQVKSEIGNIQDYLDGLPTTSDIRKKKLFENAIAVRDSFKYDEARDLFRGILSLQPSPSERIAVLILVGNTFYFQHKIQEANGSYFEALRFAQKHIDREGEGIALSNIGIIYSKLAQFDEAMGYYKDALKIYQKIDDKKGIASAFNSIAVLLQAQGNYTEAELLFRRALDK